MLMIKSQPCGELVRWFCCVVLAAFVLPGCGGEPEAEAPAAAVQEDPQADHQQALEHYLAVLLGAIEAEGGAFTGLGLGKGGPQALFDIQEKQQAMVNAGYNNRTAKFLELCQFLNKLECTTVQYELRETISREKALGDLGPPDSEDNGDYQFQFLTLVASGDQITKIRVDIPQYVQSLREETPE